MRACVYMYLIGLPDVLGVLASADWALAPVVAMATAATRTVDLEIMIDMSGVCGGVEVRGCVGVGVRGCGGGSSWPHASSTAGASSL